MTKDLATRREAIEAAKADLWSQGTEGSGCEVDPLVQASWRRCAPRFGTSERDGAPVGAADDTRERWEQSVIRRIAPGVVDRLGQVATAGDLIACVTDGDGRVLWQSTPRWLRRRAAGIGLLPGGVWHENTSGTNGIGLALAADRATAVFATEHWLSRVHDWVCYGAPVHGVDGTQVGAIDLSTTWKHANPLALAMVESLARLIEHELRLDTSTASSPPPALGVYVLGEPRATLDGQPLHLTQRQLEILTILAVAGSVRLGEMHAHLYGDRPVAIATLKAEMSRLRGALGGRLASRPYRLTLPCRVDATELLERLGTGDTEGAARLYAGQLLPASEAPFVTEHRHHLDVALRTALLRQGTSAGILKYSAVHPYDLEVLQRGRRLAPSDDPLVPALTARLAVASTM